MADPKDAALSVDDLMEQAQVFASTWSLVGGQFDSGQMLGDAEEAKAELRAMITAALAQAAPIAQAEADSARLDWLETKRQVSIDKGFQWNAWNYDARQSKLTIRQQIDNERAVKDKAVTTNKGES